MRRQMEALVTHVRLTAQTGERNRERKAGHTRDVTRVVGEVPDLRVAVTRLRHVRQILTHPQVRLGQLPTINRIVRDDQVVADHRYLNLAGVDRLPGVKRERRRAATIDVHRLLNRRIRQTRLLPIAGRQTGDEQNTQRKTGNKTVQPHLSSPCYSNSERAPELLTPPP